LKFKYVIVGGSAGGIGAVEGIRRYDKKGAIALVSEEPYEPYSRPMISNYLAGEATFEKMQFRPTYFWENYRAKPLLGRRVANINFDEKYLKIQGSKKLFFEKLLLAVGGKPFIPNVEGIKKTGIYTFSNLSDSQLLKDRIDEINKVVVIGGGLIGVSVTEAFAKLNKKVTIIELKDRILNLIVDDTTSHIIEGVMKKNGIQIITNNSVKQIKGKKQNKVKIDHVVLTDGQKIECDTVVIAIGVVPRTELLNSDDIRINKGILVDRYLSTNNPDVYACGDVSEAYDYIIGENRVLALWPLAYQGGRIAGSNMTGLKNKYQGGTIMSALKYFNVPAISVGIFNPDNRDNEYEIISSIDKDKINYKKIILKNGAICGLTFVGDIEKAGIYFNLIKEKIRLQKFKNNLLSPEFGLSHLPKSYSMKLIRRN
jgi:NAD(P)H-nitrite reductase large subunit